MDLIGELAEREFRLKLIGIDRINNWSDELLYFLSQDLFSEEDVDYKKELNFIGKTKILCEIISDFSLMYREQKRRKRGIEHFFKLEYLDDNRDMISAVKDIQYIDDIINEMVYDILVLAGKINYRDEDIQYDIVEIVSFLKIYEYFMILEHYLEVFSKDVVSSTVQDENEEKQREYYEINKRVCSYKEYYEQKLRKIMRRLSENINVFMNEISKIINDLKEKEGKGYPFFLVEWFNKMYKNKSF